MSVVFNYKNVTNNAYVYVFVIVHEIYARKKNVIKRLLIPAVMEPLIAWLLQNRKKSCKQTRQNIFAIYLHEIKAGISSAYY